MKIRFPRKVSIIFFIFLVVFLQAHKSHSSSHHQNEKPNSTTQNKESVIESHNHTQIHKNNTHSHHKDYHDTHKNHKYDKIHANNHNKKYDNVPKNSDQVKEDLKKKAMNDIKPKRQEYHHSGHYVHNNKSNTNIHNHSHSNVNSRIHGHRTVHEHGHAHAHQHGHSHGNGHSHGSKIQKGLQQNQFMKTFKQKFDDFLPNLYMKAIAGIIMLSIPSIPVFLFLFVVSKIMGSKNQGISDQWVQLMMAFSAGALLGDLFLHMMPHLLEEKQTETFLYKFFGSEAIFVYIINGLVLFFIIDFIFAIVMGKSHDHSHEKIEDEQIPQESKIMEKNNKNEEVKQRENISKNKKKKKNSNKSQIEQNPNNKVSRTSNEIIKTVVYLLGDLFHNFVDGMAVGASFVISTELGLVTSIAIFVHEVPHEIGDFAYLYKHHYTLTEILKTQILTSFGALLGGIMGIHWGMMYKLELLGFTAGAFLYLCLVNILPEVKKDLKRSRSIIRLVSTVVMLYLGVGLMYLMISFE